MKQAIQTDKAPAAGGTYSQAIKTGNTIYLAGQIPLDPVTNEMVTGDFSAQAVKVFENLKAVAEAAGGNLDSIVRLCVYITDFTNFPVVNETMMKFFKAPFPARTTIGVASLPKQSLIEVDAIMVV
jgi:reactive intermediate/imine deaminase